LATREVVRIGDAVEHQEQGLLDLVEQLLDRVGHAFHLHPGDHALVPAAAVEPVQALGRHADEVDLRALGRGGKVLRARVVARLVEEDLDHRGGVGAHAREHRVEAEDDARLALLGHAGTRSILRVSRSTRTSFTVMRSARR
jgi:hypothetical protein